MSLIQGKFFDPADPLNGSQIKLENDQNLVAKKADASDQAILKINASDQLELALVPVVPAGSDPTTDDSLARKAYVDNAVASGPTQVLFGSPDGLSIDHSEFLTYDASIGLFINEGGEQQMRPLGNDPAGPAAVIKSDLIKIEGNPGDGIALTRLQRDVIEAKKDTGSALYDASLGWDGSDSWMGVSKTTNSGNDISMVKLFPNKAQLFTIDIGAGTGPQPILPVETYDLAVKKYVDDGLLAKQDSLGTGTTSQYLRGDLTWQTVTTSEPKKEIKTLTGTDITNGYIDCAFLAIADSMRLLAGGVEHMETESYNLSVEGGVTRITFAGDLIAPAPSALVEGDKVYLQYLK